MSTSRLPEQHVGLNADWSSRAWAVQGGNDKNASTFIIDNEDGTFSFVQRFWSAARVAQDDRPAWEFADKPSAEAWGDHSGNDHIATIIAGLNQAQAASLLTMATPENRLRAVLAEATNACWTVLARAVDGGAFPPVLAMQVQQAANNAVREWLRKNGMN